MKRFLPGVAALGFVLVVAVLLPGRVIVRGDDFGYLETVVETLRRGTWSPSDWLEPFNLVLPALSLAVHAATGNLWLATLGLNALLAVAGLLLLRCWLRPDDKREWRFPMRHQASPAVGKPPLRPANPSREDGTKSSRAATPGDALGMLALACFPVGLNKAVEYTGVPLGIALTLAALLAWRSGRHRWFFGLVALAVANRQSAVGLLALPALALFQAWRGRQRLDRELALGTVLVAALALGLAAAWPATFAREVAAQRWREEFSVVRLLGNLALGGVILAGVRAGWQAWQGVAGLSTFRANLARPAVPLLLTLAGAWLVLGEPVTLACETPGWERAGPLVVLIATFLGAWAGAWRPTPDPGLVACAGAYVLLVSLRGQWWDYYFLEPAILLLGAEAPADARVGQRVWWWRGAGLVALAASTVVLGLFLRRTERQIVAYENALRAGTVAITEASDAPFGYLAWKLFPAARAHPEPSPRLIDFLRYVEGGRARFLDGTLRVDRQGGRRSLHPSRETRPLPPGWRGRDFPLSRAEWRHFLGATPPR